MKTLSERPRVTHVVPAFFGQEDSAFGGGERYALELSRNMSIRLPTSLISFGRRPRHIRMGNLEVYILKNWIHFRRFKLDPFNPFLIRHLARTDIIHFHQTYNMMSSLALLYARWSGKPIFTTDLGGDGIALHHYIDTKHWYTGHLHISEFSRRSANHFDLATASVILGGVDPDKFSPNPGTPRTDEVLYVGRLLPHKGINYLIEAIDSDTPLTIVGRRWPHAQPYYELLRRLAAGKQVTFHEDLDDAQIVEAYQRALCVVLPSVYTTVFGERHPIPELLGQTLIEGMACGTPAICTDVGSLAEVVQDGITGFVVPPNDPGAIRSRIQFLKTNPAEAGKMGRAARERALDRFTWTRAVERCLRAYGLGQPPQSIA